MDSLFNTPSSLKGVNISLKNREGCGKQIIPNVEVKYISRHLLPRLNLTPEATLSIVNSSFWKTEEELRFWDINLPNLTVLPDLYKIWHKYVYIFFFFDVNYFIYGINIYLN